MFLKGLRLSFRNDDGTIIHIYAFDGIFDSFTYIDVKLLSLEQLEMFKRFKKGRKRNLATIRNAIGHVPFEIDVAYRDNYSGVVVIPMHPFICVANVTDEEDREYLLKYGNPEPDGSWILQVSMGEEFWSNWSEFRYYLSMRGKKLRRAMSTQRKVT